MTGTRRERASDLGIAAEKADGKIRERSRDWSQVRPEWGLAGNACFIVAPRTRTRSIDLGGRSFLHDYDWRTDEGWKVPRTVFCSLMSSARVGCP